jgi:hypothetical protein
LYEYGSLSAAAFELPFSRAAPPAGDAADAAVAADADRGTLNAANEGADAGAAAWAPFREAASEVAGAAAMVCGKAFFIVFGDSLSP